ncbi:Ankyrin repeat-containing protein isoform 1 [Cladophialophora immunda]|nr:Ankyrin repeat-containing protein isoform 1 [Cladophialophora immunda]
MEAVGFAASLLTLASTLIQVSTVIRELRRNYGECPPALAKLASAVSELERLITYVKSLDETRLKDHGDLDRGLFKDSKEMVEKCEHDLSEIQQKLEQLGRPADKGFRSKLKKAVKRLNHDRDIDNWWNQVLYYNQLFSVLLTRISTNENRLNSNRRIGSLENAAMSQFAQVSSQLTDVQSSTALLPSMHMVLQSQKTTADLIARNQEGEGQRIRGIQQILSQHVGDSAQYRRTALAAFSEIHSKFDDLRGNAAQTLRMSQQDQSILSEICVGIKELQLNVDALNRKVSRRENIELNITAQESSSSLLQKNDAFAASFLRLLQLTKQSVTKISSARLKATVKDLMHILDYMKTLVEIGVSLPGLKRDGWGLDDFEDVRSIFQLTQRLRIADSGADGHFPQRYEDDLVISPSNTTFPTPISSSNRGLVKTKFISLETSIGRLDLLLRLSESYAADCEASGNVSELRFLAKVSLLPGISLAQKNMITFQCEQLHYLEGRLFKPTALSFKAIRESDSQVFRTAQYGTPQEMARLFEYREASITDCDEYGRSLLGYALRQANRDMVKYLIACGADIDSFEALHVPREESGELIYASVAMQGINLALNHSSSQDLLYSDNMKVISQAGADLCGFYDDQDRFPVLGMLLIFSSLQTFRVIIDNGEPFVTGTMHPWTPIQMLILASFDKWNFQIASKIAFLISRGADPCYRSKEGDTYLHQIFNSVRDRGPGGVYESLVTKNHDGELKDLLMLLITAGADVFAVNAFGKSVSKMALKTGHSVEWKEALEECGYDVSNVLNPGSKDDDISQQEQRRSLLTFAEYLEVRKSRLLNLEIGEHDSPASVYKKYYRMAVPEELRIHEIESSDSEMEEDEDDFDDETDINSDAQSFYSVEMIKEMD